MSGSKKDLFEDCPVMTAIVKLAVPTVIGQIILVIYNMADTFYIGLTGDEAMITSVTVCMPAFMFLSAISNLFGVGGAGVISRALGQGDLNRAGHTASFAFWGCLLTTLLYSAGAWIAINPFINLLGGSDAAVHENARQYLMVTVVFGGMATSMNALLAHLIRSEGRSARAGFGVAMGGILNIALDPLFMFVLLPPGNEPLGAAIATSLSNLCALLYFFQVIARHRKGSVISFRVDSGMLENGIPADVFGTGLPACLMTLFENISYAVLDNLMSAFGTMAQAGLGVAKKVNMLAHSIVRGMSQGVLPLIGYNYACGNYKRMKKSIVLCATLSVTMAGMCAAICLIFPRQLVGFFIQGGTESVSLGTRFLRILCIGAPFSACAYTFISFFQAVGSGVKSFLLAILRKGLLDIPLMFVLNGIIEMCGIVWATPIADIVCCGAAVVLFTSFIRIHGYPADHITVCNAQ